MLGRFQRVTRPMGRDFLVDETIEADVRSGRAAVLANQTRVLVQKVVQLPWEGKGGRRREGGGRRGVKRSKKYGGQ